MPDEPLPCLRIEVDYAAMPPEEGNDRFPRQRLAVRQQSVHVENQRLD